MTHVILSYSGPKGRVKGGYSTARRGKLQGRFILGELNARVHPCDGEMPETRVLGDQRCSLGVWESAEKGGRRQPGVNYFLERNC